MPVQFHRKKRQLQTNIEILLMSEGWTQQTWSCCSVRAALRFPTRRRRDEGNYRSILEKAAGDALVNGGWIVDDTPEHFRFEFLAFMPERGPALTVMHFTVGDEWGPIGARAFDPQGAT